jgi:dihydroxyacetone kinase
VIPLAVPKGLEPLGFEPSFDPAVEKVLIAVCQVLESSEVDLNALDGLVGDGDTGSTLARAARALRAALASLPMRQPASLLQALSQLLGRVMGGSSGVLTSIFLAAASEAVDQGWSAAWRLGLLRLQDCGGAQVGHRTLVDALDPALRELPSGLAAAASAARRGAENTGFMLQAGAGRSAQVPGQSLEGVVDPGAEAVARVFEALRTLEEPD